MQLVFVIYHANFKNKFKENTIQSLLKQSVSKFRVIFIVDDGIYNSTLKLENYLKSLKTRFHKRIKFIINYRSTGFSYAGNLAINAASGDDYMVFVNNHEVRFDLDFVKNFYRDLSKTRYPEWADIYEFKTKVFYIGLGNVKKTKINQLDKINPEFNKDFNQMVHFNNPTPFFNIDPIIFNKAFKVSLFHKHNIFMRNRVHYYLLFLYQTLFYSNYYAYRTYLMGIFDVYEINSSLNEQIKQWNHILTFYKSHNVPNKIYQAIEGAYFKFIVKYLIGFVLETVSDSETRGKILKNINLKVQNRLLFFKKNSFLINSTDIELKSSLTDWESYFLKIIKKHKTKSES